MEYIATRPLGDSRRVAVTVNKDNLVARKLYESRSFSPTGAEFDDEVELAMTLA